jgi:hypothetical protein
MKTTTSGPLTLETGNDHRIEQHLAHQLTQWQSQLSGRVLLLRRSPAVFFMPDVVLFWQPDLDRVADTQISTAAATWALPAIRAQERTIQELRYPV